MPSENEDETLREAERLITEYRNASSDLEKYDKLERFMKLWNYPDVDKDSSSGILRAVQHVGLLPLILEAMAAEGPVAISVVTMQILMLEQLRVLMNCCSAETPNPWPMHFRQFEDLLPNAFNRSLDMIQEGSEEYYIPPLRIAVLEALGRTFAFFNALDGNTLFLNRVDIHKFLNVLWACAFSLPGPYDHDHISSADLLRHFAWIISALSKPTLSWTVSGLKASLPRVVTVYGSERIAQRVKELCEDSQAHRGGINLGSAIILVTYIGSNLDINLAITKARIPKALVQAFWRWYRTGDRVKKGEDLLAAQLFRNIVSCLEFLTQTTEYESLAKKTVQDVLDEEFMMVMGKTLVTMQYDEQIRERYLRDFEFLFETILKQAYEGTCEDQDFWHTFAHVLNCARAYCRVHGDPPALIVKGWQEYRVVSHKWELWGMSIGVHESTWWDRFVWDTLPLQVRKMGCKRMKCPNFGMDFRELLTAGPTPLVCNRCRAAFYCSVNCQKEDWSNHRHRCSEQEFPAATGKQKHSKQARSST